MMDTKIECRTHQNSYELTVNDRTFLYFSVDRLLLGAAFHIVHDIKENADLDEIVKIMLGKKADCQNQANTLRRKIHSLDTNNRNLLANNKKYRQEINELKYEIKQLKKQLSNGTK